jgi:uncharacterized protein YdhG (YjbR/CyaY superfamily)
MIKFQNNDVKEKFSSYPKNIRVKLLELRELIFSVAAKTKGVGEIEECLKWNEPSYLTSQTKSGSTIRIDWKKNDPERIHLFVNCNTKLVEIYKELLPEGFDYGGNRSVSFPLNKSLPKRKLSKIIEVALTYNLNDYKNFS